MKFTFYPSLGFLALATLASANPVYSPLTALCVVIWSAPTLIRNLPVSFHSSRLGLLQLLWLLWLPLTLLWSSAPESSLLLVWTLMIFPFVFLIIQQAQYTEPVWDVLDLLLLLLACCLALWGILEPPSSTFTGRPEGPFIDPNVYAATLNIFLLPISARYLAQSSPTSTNKELALLAAIGVISLAFFTAASRGATLCAIILLPLIFWKARHESRFFEKASKFALSGLCSYLAARLIRSDDIANRLVQTLSTGDTPRWQLWKAAWQMIKEDPWAGSGFGTFRFVYPRFREAAESGTGGFWAHNDYLQFWQEGGIISLIFIIAMLAILLAQTLQALQQDTPRGLERLGLLSGCLAVFLQANVNFMFYIGTCSLLLGLFWARAEQLSNTPKLLTWVLPIRRQILLAGTTTALIGWSFFLTTQLIIQESLIGRRPLLQLAQSSGLNISNIEAANWLATLRPSAGLPNITIARAIIEKLSTGDIQDPAQYKRLFDAGIEHLETAKRGMPCYLPNINSEIDLVMNAGNQAGYKNFANWSAQLARSGLQCNPRHGLSYYQLARAQKLLGQQQDVRTTLRSAYVQVLFPMERMLLDAAWFELVDAKDPTQANNIARELITLLYRHETVPTTRSDPVVLQKIGRRIVGLRSVINSEPQTKSD